MKYRAIILSTLLIVNIRYAQSIEKAPALSNNSIASRNDNSFNKNEVKIRFAAYNVLFGLWGTPESIGNNLKKYNLDIVCFNEVPDGNWTKRVGEILKMNHYHVGKISSANHKDKYKSILSRFPLYDVGEIEVNAKGWKPASLVYASTKIKDVNLRLYSTHIPGQQNSTGSAAAFIANNIIKDNTDDNLIILGDLNNKPNNGALKSFDNFQITSIWAELEIDTSKNSTHKHIESGTESGVIDHIYFRSKQHKVTVKKGGIIYDAFNDPKTDIDMPRYKKEWIKYKKPLSDHRPIWAELIFQKLN
tara:strand:- start:213 stop:1124 length:912 start_codon:yes stop_codon:yes gene_type:complete